MAVEKMEEAANKGGDIDVQNFLSSEMNKLYLAIMQERGKEGWEGKRVG